ncbi:U2 small nuclear ribonucleoprotein auxiliary factor 35 kDa subunit-related protein 1 isoform X2 [Musca domestica]|uniref:U2 small nuclear ribonucleoprotein auxiliary factor 35 kDa subunit-related protein 1 isoform X2 n=1 Tax=Musca domestica TaxID=7370 RepID=A0ABM3UUF2_MUSDO|nr:U2 small nuclear ribonucleoprotein auxiliary factor 35 kDa subunit-related protein 1 isoform X2 [Musca domestica]
MMFFLLDIIREEEEAKAVEEQEKLRDPAYQQWLQYQEKMEEMKRQAEEKEHKEIEAMWLKREELAQKQFQKEEEQRLAREKALEQIREFQYKRLREKEEIERKKREEAEKKAEEATKYVAEIAYLCHEYLENPEMKTPEQLNVLSESRPGALGCEFYKKTQCCRYEPRCGLNHSRPLLSHVILIRNFFQHALFEKRQHKGSDRQLEFSEEDLKKDYEEFCNDVWPELEHFGKIVNFRTTRNAHPRGGHVFVEYAEKRSALKAFTNLQNRFYAGRQLSVEFSHVTYWRGALCGLALGRKCNKGDKCNFLHILANPGNKYNTKLEKIGKPKPQNPVPKGDNFENEPASSSRRNWRWSESPEMELRPKEPEKPTAPENNKTKSPIVIISSSSEDEEEKVKIKIESKPQSSATNHKTKSDIKPKQESAKHSSKRHRQESSSKRKSSQSTSDMIMISSTSDDDSDIILIQTPQRKSGDGDKSPYKHKYHKRKSSHESSSRSNSGRSRSSSAHRT